MCEKPLTQNIPNHVHICHKFLIRILIFFLSCLKCLICNLKESWFWYSYLISSQIVQFSTKWKMSFYCLIHLSAWKLTQSLGFKSFLVKLTLNSILYRHSHLFNIDTPSIYVHFILIKIWRKEKYLQQLNVIRILKKGVLNKKMIS